MAPEKKAAAQCVALWWQYACALAFLPFNLTEATSLNLEVIGPGSDAIGHRSMEGKYMCLYVCASLLQSQHDCRALERYHDEVTSLKFNPEEHNRHSPVSIPPFSSLLVFHLF